MSDDVATDRRAPCPVCGADVNLRSSGHDVQVTRWCFVCCTTSLYRLG